MASSKHQNSRTQKLFIAFILIFSLSLTVLVFSFKPKPGRYHTHVQRGRLNNTNIPFMRKWITFVAPKIRKDKIKIGLVNFGHTQAGQKHVKNPEHAYSFMHGKQRVEAVPIVFDHVSKSLAWKDLFPEWIDEDEKWGTPKCPEVPLPRVEDYLDLDVILAKVPCGGGKNGGNNLKLIKGTRDVFGLQVNLVVANLLVANGLVSNRTVYVVFEGYCGPMHEIFRCDDLLEHNDQFWVYRPELERLKQKVLMPFGSCQIGPSHDFKISGNRSRIHKDMPQKSVVKKQRVAYATILHSSEEYVCGAIALAQTIKHSNSTVEDLILLHDSSVKTNSLRGLRASGWKTRSIKRIRSTFAIKGSYNEWNYSKLRIWQLIEYDKIIFIDSDLLLLNNIDKFFSYPQLSASPNAGVRFNSGVMVIEPSMCTFNDLISKSSIVSSYNGGDQGFLNEVFTWWHRLPSKLNTLKVFEPSVHANARVKPSDTYAIHFLGWKPWSCYRDYDCNWDSLDRQNFASDHVHKMWWRVYDNMPNELKKYCGVTRRTDSRIRQWRGKAKATGQRDEHWKIKIKDPRKYHLID